MLNVTDKSLISDNQMLTNELIVMNRDLSKLKAENKQKNEYLKKVDKELLALKKNLESKENALEKLRKDRDELWAVVNTDKYRNFKSVDEEKNKIKEKYQEIKD